MFTVSVCMIVKNESAVLARCLDSLAGLYDELIIADTGSSDDTKAIALRYTDKVYDFPWTGSFSDARNFVFEKATCDYIYCSDADEVLDEENRIKFKALIQSLDGDVEIVQMRYANQLQFNTTYNFDEEPRPKLYKRLRKFVWQYDIHEAVRTEPIIFDSDIKILHMPQSLHSKRDFSIYHRLTAKGDLPPHLFMMYARELFISGDDDDFAAAYEYFRQSVRSTPLSSENMKQGLCVLAKAAFIIGNEAEMFSAALKNTSDGHGSSEVCCVLGDYYFSKNDYDEAAVWYLNAAYETSPELSIKCGREYPLTMMSKLCELAGDNKGAAHYLHEIGGGGEL